MSQNGKGRETERESNARREKVRTGKKQVQTNEELLTVYSLPQPTPKHLHKLQTHTSERPKNEVKQPERDFAEFYFEVISKLYDMKCPQISCDVKSALGYIRAMKHEDNRTKEFSFSYKIPPVRCAYLYGYSVLHSVMIYSEFLKHLKLNKIYLIPTLSTESLKICCIGGGPGTEALAIWKSINDFVVMPQAKSEESLVEVKVTVVDKLPHWKREETAVINAVNEKSNILHSENVILQSDFLKADILKPFEKNLKEKIKEADIVTVIKVASNIQEIKADDYKKDLDTMIRNVTDCMEDSSCLFMLDSAGGNLFYNMRDVLKEDTGPLLLTETNHKDYFLDQKTVTRLSTLMRYKNSNYHPILPTARGKVSSCMWIKNMLPVSENIERSCFSDLLQYKESTVLHSQSEASGRLLRKKKRKELNLMKKKYPDVLIISNMKTKKKSTRKSACATES